MPRKNVQIMSFKQHTTPNAKVTQPEYKHPPTHKKENLSTVEGKGHKANAKQLILYKDDVNSY